MEGALFCATLSSTMSEIRQKRLNISELMFYAHLHGCRLNLVAYRQCPREREREREKEVGVKSEKRKIEGI